MIKNVLWDFDGVILDSMDVRDFGFKKIFQSYADEKVEQLINYHRENGGLSRYVKIKFFYEKILGSPIQQDLIQEYATQFSEIMKVELTNPSNLILDSVDFIRENNENYNFHIVSGSDEKELRFLCEKLEINRYFLSIDGSPTPKKDLIKDLLQKYLYKTSETCLIGDSINDFEAARENNLLFFGYNNENLKNLGDDYISSFMSSNVFLDE